MTITDHATDVTTWADAYGRWWADVPGHGRAAMMRARRAIANEIRQRQAPQEFPLHLTLAEVRGCSYGCGDPTCTVTRSVYRER